MNSSQFFFVFGHLFSEVQQLLCVIHTWKKGSCFNLPNEFSLALSKVLYVKFDTLVAQLWLNNLCAQVSMSESFLSKDDVFFRQIWYVCLNHFFFSLYSCLWMWNPQRLPISALNCQFGMSVCWFRSVWNPSWWTWSEMVRRNHGTEKSHINLLAAITFCETRNNHVNNLNILPTCENQNHSTLILFSFFWLGAITEATQN